MPTNIRVFVLSSMLLMATAITWSQSVDASEPPTSSSLDLEASVEPSGGVTLSLSVAFASDLNPNLVGLDIYRTVVGECNRARITEELLALPTAGTYEFQANDTIDPNTIHRYEVFAVDDRRLLLLAGAFELGRSVSYAQPSAEAIVGIGQVFSLGPDALFVPCPDSCWKPLLTVRSPSLEEFIDTGTEVILTGYVDCDDPRGCVIVAGAEVMTCSAVLASESVTWGALKSRF